MDQQSQQSQQRLEKKGFNVKRKNLTQHEQLLDSVKNLLLWKK